MVCILISPVGFRIKNRYQWLLYWELWSMETGTDEPSRGSFGGAEAGGSWKLSPLFITPLLQQQTPTTPATRHLTIGDGYLSRLETPSRQRADIDCSQMTFALSAQPRITPPSWVDNMDNMGIQQIPVPDSDLDLGITHGWDGNPRPRPRAGSAVVLEIAEGQSWP